MAEIEWPLIIPVDDRTWWDALTADERTQAQNWATEILWALSGRVFGTRLVTVRPSHRPPRRGSTYDGTLSPGRHGVYAASGLLIGSTAQVLTQCSCIVDDCRHQTAADLALPGPVAEVVEIRIDGAVVPDTTYRIRNHRWVRRTDGRAWPMRQNLNAADNEVGAFAVTYRQGIDAPEAAQYAAGIMAVEYIKSRRGQKCRLPRGVTEANRNGLQVTIDPRAYFAEGMTGIEDVDQWLLAVNPHRLSQTSEVLPAHDLATEFTS
ncbi:head-to-tail adaptor [Gordonia phage Tardus]|uniref:Head-to-tail adaptor n=1 Tax=Gordonia phage Tardus TaxID=2939734 RepID=A0A9E7E5K2_9CAUD|nr:head-to-tail adaptor [Gordonia phage Tardus]